METDGFLCTAPGPDVRRRSQDVHLTIGSKRILEDVLLMSWEGFAEAKQPLTSRAPARRGGFRAPARELFCAGWLMGRELDGWSRTGGKRCERMGRRERFLGLASIGIVDHLFDGHKS